MQTMPYNYPHFTQMKTHTHIKSFLDSKVELYNQPSFIPSDPICIPHLFSKQQDIEIMGFFAAIFAWGQRVTIINKCKDLIQRMDNAPHDFVLHHTSKELKQLLHFKHRTFNDTDLLYFISFFKQWYQNNNSLETAFSNHINPKDQTIENGLIGFRQLFFSDKDHLPRTYKHISSPLQNSACKRINMYLRWMVRKDKHGVDFGLWSTIKPSQLMCPLDVHVQRVALKLNILQRPQSDWKAVEELTQNLRILDPKDPIKYDFALFGLGVMEKF
jgi:uncharacterized protein (TIGR02757 family)